MTLLRIFTLRQNKVDKLSHYEIGRLLDRSIDAIHDASEQTGIAGTPSARDVLVDLRISSERARDLSAEALVDVADVTRELKIALDRTD
ncbi:hypothetical protein [Ensifer aridi]|uniref:hypothetical protein n=1 Tax=Ensifer aridi TaxID=1708715 RepID=UPI00040F0DC4|nr:hypothetical protein [Ensifer aridi]